MEIPKEILDINTNLGVTVDVILVNKMPFAVSVIKGLKLATLQYILNRTEKELVRYINKILDIYKTRFLNPYYVHGP